MTTSSLEIRPPLDLKNAADDVPHETGSMNPDDVGNDIIDELEKAETKLRYSIRRTIARFLMWISVCVLVVYTWHLVAPACLKWLSESEMEAIKGVAVTVFGSLALSIGTMFYSKK